MRKSVSICLLSLVILPAACGRVEQEKVIMNDLDKAAAGKHSPGETIMEEKQSAGRELVFSDDFTDGLDNWVIEDWDGKVSVDCKDGKMRVETHSRINGVMVWCKKELPDNFIFEFDVTPLSESGFFLLFFDTQGEDGGDILSDKFFKNKPDDVSDYKNCLFYKYTSTNINGYHISYRRNESATCNLRKNSGKTLLKQEKLDEILPTGQKVHVVLSKAGGRIKLTVGDTMFMDYTDDGEEHGAVWNCGRFGFRQVYDSEGLYENVRLYELR